MQTSAKKFPVIRISGLGLAILIMFTFGNPLYAQFTLTSGNNATTTSNIATSITGFQIVGPAASTTPVQLRVTSGSLSMTTTTGLTFDGVSTGATINFSGTIADINAALSTLRYTRASIGTDTLEISLVNRGEVFFVDNGHLYKYISGSYTWSAAKTAAEAQTAYGATGYLATITSLTENNFVYNRISGDGWLGTTDIETEKNWKWVTGPETGTAYFQENPSGGGGNSIGGSYNAWASGEPNDYGGGEDCGYMYSSQSGMWNDFPCGTQQGYVVEFGATSSMPTVVATNVSVVTADVPAITSLSPANSATNIQTNANSLITFTKTITKGTGNILLKKASDDSTVESIDVAGSKVTGGGSTTITINPDIVLDENTTYYLLIPNTAFRDNSSNYFEGITATATWKFTTGDFTPPLITSVAGTSTATSTALVTWVTNELTTSKIIYGLTPSYSTSTAEGDTSPRVISHTRVLSNLLSCTTYHYAVVSRDAAGFSATSTDAMFTSSGCTASSTPTSATSTVITSSTGGTTNITESGKSFTVAIPTNVTATSSSLVIQIQTIPSAPVITTLGRPSVAPNEVGLTVFDVKAIINGDTILDTFDHPVTISYQYTDGEISGLTESSLWLYHYHDNAWSPLDNCTINTITNSITCTTPNFSIFGLFGQAPPAPPVGPTFSAGIPLGCTDPISINYNSQAAHRQNLCIYKSILALASTTPISAVPETVSLNYSKCPSYTFTRTLRFGMKGDDVKELQKLMNCLGFILATSGPGAPGEETNFFVERTYKSVIAFQEKYGNEILKPIALNKATGIFAELSRAKAKILTTVQ